MKLNFKHYGNKNDECLIILHGLLGSLDNWHSIATLLSEKLFVVTLDARNHGKSPHSGDFNYKVMADDVIEHMDSHEISSANIAGHSMGGKTAMELALEYPDRAGRLIVADMAPKAYEAHHSIIFEALLSLNPAEFKSRKDADRKLSSKIPQSGIRQFLLKNIDRRPEGGFRWKMNLDVLHSQYKNMLKPIESEQPFPKPALFIKGGSSGYIQESDKKLIRSLFPKAVFRTMPDTGHWVHAEKPDLFLKIVSEFLLSADHQ